MSLIVQTEPVEESRKDQLIRQLADAAMVPGSTFGPNGKLVLIHNHKVPYFTQDGFAVIKEMAKDEEDLAAQLLHDATMKVAQKAGDGTTTCCLLIAYALKNGIDLRSIDVETYLQSIRKESNEDTVIDVAVTATKNKEIGKKIGKLIWRLGKDGFIQPYDDPMGTELVAELVAGYNFPGKVMLPQCYRIKSPYVKGGVNHVSVHNPLIVSVAHTMSGYEGVGAVINAYLQRYSNAQDRPPLIFVAADMEKEGIDLIAKNVAVNNLPVFLVGVEEELPMRRHNILSDLSYLTDATVYSTLSGKKISREGKGFTGEYGTCMVAHFSPDMTRFVSETDATPRIEEIKGASDGNSEFNQRRISSLSGAVGKVIIPMTTTAEGRNLGLIVEDGARSAQASLRHGWYVGGRGFWEGLADACPELSDLALDLAEMLPKDSTCSDSVLAFREAYAAAASLVSQINNLHYVL